MQLDLEKSLCKKLSYTVSMHGNASGFVRNKRDFMSRAPNDGFLLSILKPLFRLSRVLLDLKKCILSGALKFVSLRYML